MISRFALSVSSWKRVFCSQASRSLAYFVQNVQTDDTAKMLHVRWENNAVNRFPYVFLRDNCQCQECFHASAQQRAFDTIDQVDLKVEAKEVSVSKNGEVISIIWPDEHESLFQADWLRKRCFPEQKHSSKNEESIARKGVVLWNGAKLQDRIPDFDYQQLMADDFMLMTWLNKLHSHGITMVKNVPIETGSSRKLTDRVGYLKPTYFGDIWHVKSEFGAHNLAYTAHELPLHTDLPQCVEYPGIQLLHCIKQAAGIGGSNMFVDGFNVAQKLKETEPRYFKLFSTVSIPFSDAATYMYGECDMQYSRPIIKLDDDGNIVEFSFNNHTRDAILPVSPEETLEFYEAYVTLGRMLRDPANRIDHKLKPGEMMVFNNSRVLHGRTAFTVTREATRILEGNYIDWDIAYSRLRVLAKKFDVPIEF